MFLGTKGFRSYSALGWKYGEDVSLVIVRAVRQNLGAFY